MASDLDSRQKGFELDSRCVDSYITGLDGLDLLLDLLLDQNINLGYLDI